MELDGPASPTVAVLGAGIHPALVRVSKGAGTRGGLPDLLGLAVRLTDLPDGPVDLLYSTVGRHRCTGALLAPASGWCTRPYSTLLPYRADGERVTSDCGRSSRTGHTAPTRRSRGRPYDRSRWCSR